MRVTPKNGLAESLGPIAVELKDPVYCGLAVSSHNAEVSETAVFSDVKLTSALTK